MVRSALRFFRLGLRTNPFYASDLLQEKVPGPGTRQAEDLLTRTWSVVMLTGDRGAGKTHLSEWLLWKFRQQGRRTGYLHLAAPAPLAPPVQGVEVFVLDEAQRARPGDLRALGRWVLGGKGRRLLVTTHEDVSRSLGTPSLLSLRVAGVSLVDLNRYLDRRLQDAALPGKIPRVSFPEVTRRALLVHCRGNFLRLVDLLYQICENLPEHGRVGPEEVTQAAARIPEESSLLGH